MIKYSPTIITLDENTDFITVNLESEYSSSSFSVNFVTFNLNESEIKFDSCFSGKYALIEEDRGGQIIIKQKVNKEFIDSIERCIQNTADGNISGLLIERTFKGEQKNKSIGAVEQIVIPIINETNHELKTDSILGADTELLRTSLSCNPSRLYLRSDVVCSVGITNNSESPLLLMFSYRLNSGNPFIIAEKLLILPNQDYKTQFLIDKNSYYTFNQNVRVDFVASTVSGEGQNYFDNKTYSFDFYPIIILLILSGLIISIFAILIGKYRNKFNLFLKWLQKMNPKRK